MSIPRAYGRSIITSALCLGFVGVAQAQSAALASSANFVHASIANDTVAVALVAAVAVPADTTEAAPTKRGPLIQAGQKISIVFEQTEDKKAFPGVAVTKAVFLGDKLTIVGPDGKKYKARAASNGVVHLIIPQ